MARPQHPYTRSNHQPTGGGGRLCGRHADSTSRRPGLRPALLVASTRHRQLGHGPPPGESTRPATLLLVHHDGRAELT